LHFLFLPTPPRKSCHAPPPPALPGRLRISSSIISAISGTGISMPLVILSGYLPYKIYTIFLLRRGFGVFVFFCNQTPLKNTGYAHQKYSTFRKLSAPPL
jgi:hypothetical protein